jgi:hypothetical protein
LPIWHFGEPIRLAQGASLRRASGTAPDELVGEPLQ